MEVVAHSDELAWRRSGRARFEEGFDAADWSVSGTRWRPVDAETEVAPGVTVLPTPEQRPARSRRSSCRRQGPGSSLPTPPTSRRTCSTPCRGSCAGGAAVDEQMATESLQLLLARARAADARLVPGHDQVVVTAIRHPSGGHH